MDKVTIIKPDDFHVHFRSGEMLRVVVPETAQHFARALVMPNVPAIETWVHADDYRDEIRAAAGYGFQPLMTLKLTARTTPEMIREACDAGVVACKIYPTGATTGSHDGIADVEALVPVLGAMQSAGMVLCIHAEDPSAFVLDREEAYLDRVAWIVRNFPGLKVVIEHITTRAAVDFIRNASVNVAGTITAHHLINTLDDLIGDGIRPHLYCKPVPKREEDRSALVTAAIHQNGGRYIFGSDSAPHRREDKESACGCAGVFSAPVALSVLAEVFLGSGRSYVKELQAFTSERGADFYGLPRNTGTITLERRDWTVPEAVGGVVPLWAGRVARWRVADGRDDR
jgi:dihydroorotase